MDTTTVSSFEMKTGSGLPRTLRLTSTRGYERTEVVPQRVLASTYDGSIGTLDAERARELCVRSRQAVQRNSMLKGIVLDSDPATLTAAATATASPDAAAGASETSGHIISSTDTAEDKEKQVAAMAALAESFRKEPVHGIRGALVTEFFSAGSVEGPFPGSRSSQGEFMASTFYAHAKPGTTMATLRPSHYSSSGYKLKT